MNNGNVLLMVLKSGKSKTRMLVDSGSRGFFLSASMTACFPLYNEDIKGMIWKLSDVSHENGVLKTQSVPKAPTS